MQTLKVKITPKDFANSSGFINSVGDTGKKCPLWTALKREGKWVELVSRQRVYLHGDSGEYSLEIPYYDVWGGDDSLYPQGTIDRYARMARIPILRWFVPTVVIELTSTF